MSKFIRKSRSEREQEIISAATKVFLRKGYRGTTMEDVIAETTLSKGGFYHYFKSTREIFFAIMDGYARAEVSHLKALESSCGSKDEFIDRVSAYLAQKVLSKSEERDIYLMGASETFYDPEYLEYLNKMEHRYVAELGGYCTKRFPDRAEEEITAKLELLSELLHALIISCHLFKKEGFYRENQKFVKKMFAGILAEM